MEEEFLLENLKELKIDDNYIKDMNELSNVLVMTKMNDKAEELKKLVKEYISEVNAKIDKLFLFKQIKYVNEHPELVELFPNFGLNFILFNENEKDANVINIKKENK